VKKAGKMGKKVEKKWKIRTDFTGPPMGDEIIRSHLHGFWGEIWPARSGRCEKKAQKCARIYLAGAFK
jgi:hypothetical protein